MKSPGEKINYEIRTACNDDIPAIVALVKEILHEFNLPYDSENSDSDLTDIEATYTHNGGRFWVVIDESDQVMGTIGLYKMNSNECKLRKMYVSNKCRGQKIGEHLLQMALNKAVMLGFRTMVLETFHTMTAAMKLYEKYGFKFVYDEQPVSPRCDRFMQKQLQTA